MSDEDDLQDEPRVGALELFSDLVFVFAITQLTTVLVNHPTWAGLGHTLLPFGMVWWMYGGYIWLTNAVRPTTTLRKLLILSSMAGFLMMGLAIPRAFEGNGVLFGIGYLLVVLIHTGLFTQASTSSTFAGVVRVAPFNIASAILLIIGGAQTSTTQTVLWAVALAVQIVTPFLTRVAAFRIEPGHFVERYNLLVLIVLGESVVAVGAAGKANHLGALEVGTSVLGLALTAALWWSYFSEDALRAEAALDDTPEDRRPMAALASFFYAQIPMLLGVVAIATAIRTMLPHPAAAASASAAWLLAGGATAFLLGGTFFRIALRFHLGIWRPLAAPLLLATAVIGLKASALAQLGALAAIQILALVAEAAATRAKQRQSTASIPSEAVQSRYRGGGSNPAGST